MSGTEEQAPFGIGDRVWVGISIHHYTVVSDRQPVVGVPGRFEYVVQPDDGDNSWAVEERFIHRLPAALAKAGASQ